MSTEEEKIEAIERAFYAAKRRFSELEDKPTLSRAETFEKEMAIECMNRAEIVLENYRLNRNV